MLIIGCDYHPGFQQIALQLMMEDRFPMSCVANLVDPDQVRRRANFGIWLRHRSEPKSVSPPLKLLWLKGL